MTCFFYNEDSSDFQSHTPLPGVGAGDRRPVYPEGSTSLWCATVAITKLNLFECASFNVTESLLIAAGLL